MRVAHNARMKMVIGFLTMIVLAIALWRLLSRQEESDPGFQRRLEADDRRARANREAAARSSHAPPTGANGQAATRPDPDR